ncbi:MAG: hypothetical protein GY750_10505 [Lentisphaerae bacterium]|nr:hypothetical protein [Lentisphaerota bacterium]MCP4101842.1 hypothetical protein [Lentisphaerota bacterium]
MKRVIYYFSGTGNTLALAKQLSKKLNGCDLVAVNSIKEKTINPQADVIGLMFPVYAFNMPRIFQAFVKNKLQISDGAYVFAVSNFASMEFGALSKIKKLIRSKGHKLNMAAGIKMPSNYIPFGGAESEKSQTGKFLTAESDINNMAELIKKSQDYPYHFLGETLFRLISSLAGRSFNKRLKADAARFYADDKCNSCGLCAKVCPVGNIHLAAGKPVWGEECEQCLACLQWCPEEAIQMLGVNPARIRYHHPDIKASDLVEAKTNN